MVIISIKEELEKYGFFLFEHIEDKYNELKEQFVEMSQLKSDFDIEKLTIRKQGNFIAHNFHFLMRQYSLALSELRRMLIEKESLERKIKEFDNRDKEKVIIYTNNGKTEKYADLYTKELINQLDNIELGIVNKAMMVRGFEICRLKLIELNGGKVPTNEDYQKEEPEYLKWVIESIIVRQIRQRSTGIMESTWTNIDMLEEPALINEKFQVKILDDNGNINMNKIIDNLKNRQKLSYNTKELILGKSKE